MFGMKKKKSEMPSKWTFTSEYIKDNELDIRYERLDLHVCYNEELGDLCIWHNGKHLTTIKCARQLYEDNIKYPYLKTKQFIPKARLIELEDVEGNRWSVESDSLSSSTKSYSLAGLTFELRNDKVEVYNYGALVLSLDTTDKESLTREKYRYLDHKHQRLDEVELETLLANSSSLYSKLVDEEQSKRKTQHDKIIITTEMGVNFDVQERIEIISAEVAFGMNIFKDLFASMSDAFGGRNKSIQNTLKDARELVMAELRKEAYELGADAVIAVDLDYSEFSGNGKSMLFVVATGTAVKLGSRA